MAVETALVTVDEFLRLQPPKAGHYELHHGEIVLMTAPKWGHQRIQDRLVALLRSMAGARAYVTKETIACAASSITSIPRSPAIFMMGSISAQPPNKCTGMIARTLGCAARTLSIRLASRLNVSSSTSTKTGTAPTREIAPAVAKNV